MYQLFSKISVNIHLGFTYYTFIRHIHINFKYKYCKHNLHMSREILTLGDKMTNVYNPEFF